VNTATVPPTPLSVGSARVDGELAGCRRYLTTQAGHGGAEPGDSLPLRARSMGGHCGRSAVPVVRRAVEALNAEAGRGWVANRVISGPGRHWPHRERWRSNPSPRPLLPTAKSHKRDTGPR
jgi:hypothetical protein